MTHRLLSASLLCARMTHLGEDAQRALDAGMDRLHLDMMDQRYVPHLSFGPSLCQQLRSMGIVAPIDVHLMTNPARDLAMACVQAGASSVVFHLDTEDDTKAVLNELAEQEVDRGLVLSPHQSWEDLKPLAPWLTRVLIMTVVPGRGGQSLLTDRLPQARDCAHWLATHHPHVQVECDGGIHAGNINTIERTTGIHRMVIGSGLFQHQDLHEAVQALRA